MTCSKCGKAFDYPPAQSRIDGSDLCRICSAEEALDAAHITDKESILSEVRKHEYGT